MNEFTCYVGNQIKSYRKAARLTLQQLGDAIHKSRATVCKYESGEISPDLETLYEISQILQVSPAQLTAIRPDIQHPFVFGVPAATETTDVPGRMQKNPFFQARRLYFYFYDGRCRRIKDGSIDIGAQTDVPNTYEATFSICTLSGNGRSSETFYTGTVLYSDMLIRFSFVNQYNPLEEDLLYIFNPLERRSFTDGLLCGISSTDLMPCAFKCFITLKPQELTDNLQQHLLFTRAELQRWKKLNMLLIDNNAEGLI